MSRNVFMGISLKLDTGENRKSCVGFLHVLTTVTTACSVILLHGNFLTDMAPRKVPWSREGAQLVDIPAISLPPTFQYLHDDYHHYLDTSIPQRTPDHNMANLSPYIPTTSNGSNRSVTLLTPPQSPTLSEDIPFKPKDDDDTSLSMKRGRHGHNHDKNKKPSRRELNRACLSSEELRITPPRDNKPSHPYHSKSLPSLANSNTFYRPRKPDLLVRTGGTGSPDQSRRRWTLPSKAAAIRSRTTTVSAENKPAMSTSPDDSGLLSPAMITLRRATTIKTSPRKTSLTFFPEPKFERSRTGFLTTFLRAMTGISDKEMEPSWPRVERRRSSGASIDSEGARPSPGGNASTVCTNITDVQPIISQPAGSQNEGSPFMRRCSTKYITRDQVYEVIWDENLSDSSGSTTGPAVDPEGRPANRRRSVAMGLLEMQLHKAEAQSHRQSQIIQEQEQDRKSSCVPEYERQRQGSLQSILRLKLSRFVTAEATLKDVPRSKASRLGKAKSPATSSNISNTIPEDFPEHPEFEQTACSMEFFPPLRSRATTTTSKPDSHAAGEAPPIVDETAFRRNSQSTTPSGLSRGSLGTHSSPFGGMVGASTHMRRRSAAGIPNCNGRQKRGAFNESRRASAMGMPTLKTTVEDETTPLLSAVGMLE